MLCYLPRRFCSCADVCRRFACYGQASGAEQPPASQRYRNLSTDCISYRDRIPERLPHLCCRYIPVYSILSSVSRCRRWDHGISSYWCSECNPFPEAPTPEQPPVPTAAPLPGAGMRIPYSVLLSGAEMRTPDFVPLSGTEMRSPDSVLLPGTGMRSLNFVPLNCWRRLRNLW